MYFLLYVVRFYTYIYFITFENFFFTISFPNVLQGPSQPRPTVMQPSYLRPMGPSNQSDEEPADYLIWSIINTLFCCWILGIWAIAKSREVIYYVIYILKMPNESFNSAACLYISRGEFSCDKFLY